MVRKWICVTALAVAVPQAHAQDAEAQKLREELRQMQQRVDALEQRPRQTGENAFNPSISLILQGTAARSSQDPADLPHRRASRPRAAKSGRRRAVSASASRS